MGTFSQALMAMQQSSEGGEPISGDVAVVEAKKNGAMRGGPLIPPNVRYTG